MAVNLLIIPNNGLGQVINLGTASDFVIFSSVGAVTNTGFSELTGNVGTNSGAFTGFGNVNGNMHTSDAKTIQAAADLLIAYEELAGVDPKDYIAPILGNVQILEAGVYSIADPTTLNFDLTLDGKGDPNSGFIHIEGALSTVVNANVILINGAKPENVYCMVSAAVSIGDYTKFVGNILCNSGAMDLFQRVNLIGRALTTISSVHTYTITATATLGRETLSSPLIIDQPTDQIACDGDVAVFTVNASGTDLTYQWRIGTIDLIDGGNITGATTNTLVIDPVSAADISDDYNVVINGECGTELPPIDLASAGNFAILAGTGITSSGESEIHDMDIGLSPGVRSSIVGFPPAIVVNGAIYASDDLAPLGVEEMLIQAKQELTDAYLLAEAATAPTPITVAGDQGGLTLAPGIYKSTSTLLIQSGDLTLDAQDDINASWIFQVASDLTTIGGAGGNVILTGGAQANNVTWQVGSSATIGNGTSFAGNILVLTSITMNTSSSIDGRLLARNGAVVLSGANILNSPSDSVPITETHSIFVSLDLGDAPIITIQPTNQTACVGDPVSFTVDTTGTYLTYQWKIGEDDIVNGPTISGATTNTLTIDPTSLADAAINYNVVVSGLCLPDAISDVIILRVYPTLDFGTIYHDPQELQDESSAIIVLTELWKRNTDFRVYYTIDGIVEVPVTVTSDAIGNAFFETRILDAATYNNTFIVITGINEIELEEGEDVEIDNPCVLGLKQTHLHFEGYIPLPIQLAEFNTVCQNNKVLINWITTSEMNNDYFIIEKSHDMITFEKVTIIYGNGFSNTNIYYSYTDKYPYHGDNYYRLTQVDFNGILENFNTVYLNCNTNQDENKARINVFPNPFSYEINIVLENFHREKIRTEVYDELGKKILTEIFISESVSDTKTINLSHLAKGMYFLIIKSNKEIFNKTITKR